MKSKKIIWFIVMVLLLVGLAACGGGDDTSDSDTSDTSATENEETAVVSTGDPEAGKSQYEQVCIACHGPEGTGIEGLGKPFTTSEFLQENNDEEMLAFIKAGRPSGDPLNTTGVDMPPKGGNPALTDEQILDIIAYVRTLQ
ncbi:MAG: hypothetical protein DHS20C20_02890 [Ardenticatenaceae bacterium]|nr:MAG: hypothetical protein DHS20C20_02890 [Ardenticatenaceae bacterium]